MAAWPATPGEGQQSGGSDRKSFSNSSARSESEIAMSDPVHKFKIGQTVDLLPSMGRSAASGHYEIVSLRPADGGYPQYRIKSKNESHERVVSESDLILYRI
jgi:hypothetical protein